jgi:hypothetical protein
MKRKPVLLVLLMSALGLGTYMYSTKPVPAGKHDTTFPTHLAGFVPDAPPTCHSIYQKKADGTLEFLEQHDILDDQGGPIDMRRLSGPEREAVIQADFKKDRIRMGMEACSGVGPDWFFPAAYAQPHCTDCQGGCPSWTCPGHFVGQLCALGGGSCVVTIICCSGDCTPNC